MDEESRTYSLDEFNHAVDEGEIMESSVSGKNQSIRILCSVAINLRGAICGTHLRDLWCTKKAAQAYMFVGCGVCGFSGYRKIGTRGLINGHSLDVEK